MTARPGLVLIPGLACDGEVFADVAPRLADVAEVVVADLGEAASLGAMAEAVLAAAPPAFALLGFSMGGYVALELLRRVPQRVTALALLDTTARPDDDEATARRRGLVRLAGTRGMGAAVEALWPFEVAPSRLDDLPLRDRMLRMGERCGVDGFARQQEAIIARPDSRSDLPGVAVPAVVVVGRDDRITPVAESEQMAAAIPDARLVVLDDCGHFAPLEQPGELAAVLREWLRRAGVDGAVPSGGPP